jgi:hypothetical protein
MWALGSLVADFCFSNIFGCSRCRDQIWEIFPVSLDKPPARSPSLLDVVYLCWPIALSYTSPNCGGIGRGVAGSPPMSTAVHITWYGAQINFGYLPPPYLTYASMCYSLHSYFIIWCDFACPFLGARCCHSFARTFPHRFTFYTLASSPPPPLLINFWQIKWSYSGCLILYAALLVWRLLRHPCKYYNKYLS